MLTRLIVVIISQYKYWIIYCTPEDNVNVICQLYLNLKNDFEARIYNGEMTVSSASGVEKAGQPHVNQWS